MLKRLPIFIDPLRLAQQGCSLKGAIALSQMTRLRDSLCGVRGEAIIDWSFTTDEHHHLLIQGRTQAVLPMLCQRCLQLLEWPVDTTVALIILTGDQTDEEVLLTGYETLTLTSTTVSLAALVEDELILALPIVAKHGQCPSNEYLSQMTLAEELARHPFSVLHKLKQH
ncbi:MAG: hypothetical protein BWK79_03090 [Beggiatoa sp. IS2]|nr:MAG: hypothetical protein BWK79_03090 [Beggiatoa sp. IS2]